MTCCVLPQKTGSTVNYAYGWVELDSPSGIPLEIVVGLARDPLMFATIRVADMKESVSFFKQELGMQELPYPLARVPGSQYERPQPKGSIFLSYGVDTMGLLLLPPPSGKPSKIVIGTQLDAFTIVVDDSVSLEGLPETVQRVLAEAKTGVEPGFVYSPDGYKFRLLPFSRFAPTTTSQVVAA